MRRSAGTLLLVLGAAATAVGLGTVAIAGPGAPPTELMPTSELAAGGGVAAPGAGTPDGAVEAPAAEPAPAEPVPPVDVPPGEVAPEVPTGAVPVPDETVAPEELPATEDEEPETAPEQAEPDPETEEEPVEEPLVPTRAEVLSEAKRPLVPVAILSAPVESASEGEPLIADGEVLAQAAQEDDGEGGGDDEPENGDEGEVVIPVDPGDDGDETPENGGEDGTLQPDGAPRAVSRGDGLALTGLAVEGPLGAGAVLLLLGTWLRITARPTSAPARA